MRRYRRQRRGFMLIFVVMVMGLVGGLISVLALNSARYYRDRQQDQVRNVSQAVTASAVAYARAQLSASPTTRPAGPIELDVAEILPPKFAGSAVVSFLSAEKSNLCKVSTRIQRGSHAVVDNVEFEVKSPSS